MDLSNFVDLTQTSLHIALASISFNPIWWNMVAQNEHRNRTITRLLRGNARLGCYLLAVAIFSLGVFRDTLYTRALKDQPNYPLLPPLYSTLVPVLLFSIGQTLVISSTWALGITGTFLGDYFGILLDDRVEGFPFNVVENPMYVGSTLCFAAGALWYEKPAGLLITAYVYIVYSFALRYEGPFTEMIYASRGNRMASAKKEL
ncbi:phospholipid methyltransferase [Gautieria morchelliformis]|nr:phospholipid methyltransferase [Gautieria morchelliformis]